MLHGEKPTFNGISHVELNVETDLDEAEWRHEHLLLDDTH